MSQVVRISRFCIWDEKGEEKSKIEKEDAYKEK